MEYQLLIDGQWMDGGSTIEVTNKYSGEVIGTLPSARQGDVQAAVDAAERAEPVMRDMPAHKRAEILLRTAELIQERADDLAKTIAAEAGKALKFARGEVARAVNTFTAASEEAKRLHGETYRLTRCRRETDSSVSGCGGPWE
jgi:acyl-CoA reductase-like NAD-dependent aldehyde dehydrogenase